MEVEYLRKLHRYSGRILAVFFIFHMINHLFAWGGADLHIQVMKWFRVVYRSPPVEVLLIGSAGLQIISGIVLVINWRVEKDRYAVMQIASGLFLAFFLVYHIKAIMTARYYDTIETDFYFATWGVKNSPSDRFFIPYYGLSVLCVVIHLACAHRSKMLSLYKERVPFISIRVQVFSILCIGLVLTTFILVGLIRAE